ncbi:hypothetical protein BASA50_006615 [Batrachochytrium salamandrivorans]|uniref:Homoserine dehydrogenase n=1 Tax=Batrachochytrium salamandrivorans TaxID=1357716 RepID=A0ABQ8FCE8_9FUNG|nr:hypothetical protein BASA60_000333 [Batrachochytrium salamandrivorans]KAH6594367.1 hypothetical protein BASA50_006615 [Batrachochytrium salamandrivorans]
MTSTPTTVHIALIGPGLVGAEFLAQVAAYQQQVKEASTTSLQPRLVVVGIATSSRQLTQPSIDLTTWKAALAASTESTLDAFLTHASKYSPCILVDATSSNTIAESYPDCISRHGLHIVTPNKKAFSADLDLYQRIIALANTHNKKVLHEATVGAGLPILSTLNDLVDTGDEIIKIEGVFSGTLSYIFNAFSSVDTAVSSTPSGFSDIVKQAKSLGYTEPDPRDDLNGMDVARKVVILARLAGVPLSTDTLPIETVVPATLEKVTPTEFMDRLVDYDDHFDKMRRDTAEKDAVLRYVGVVDVRGKCGQVNMVAYDKGHPFASLKGSDNIVAFTTKRFPNSLIVQGAGAGAAVTAYAMLADVLKIARMV